jgi:nitroreductase
VKGEAMDLWSALKERRSIRVFKPDSVPRALIEKIISAATEAPSSSNMQPWEFVVVAGKERDRLGQILVGAFTSEGKDYDFEGDKGKPFPEKILQRRWAFYDELFQKAKEKGLDPKKFLQEGTYNFWGAPVVVFAFIDETMGKRFVFDIGAAVENLLLAAQAEGLGTHLVRLIVKFEDKIKETLRLPLGKSLVIGICLGYPDPNALINQYKPKRTSLGEIVTWIGC